MKTSFTYNLLKHFRDKKEQGGFTLIELLVVIIIIGILAAIALPSFLNQANRARESEASNYVGAVNRGQQAYFLEKLVYATDAGLLEVGVPEQTDNFTYGDETGDFDGLSADQTSAIFHATARKASLKSFAGMIYNTGAQREVTGICRADTAAAAAISDPTGDADGVDCANGSTSIGG
ncbi:MAG: type IV pilin-like G/H family protein [Cyanobacteria bacterium P01_F01_bin.56]